MYLSNLGTFFSHSYLCRAVGEPHLTSSPAFQIRLVRHQAEIRGRPQLVDVNSIVPQYQYLEVPSDSLYTQGRDFRFPRRGHKRPSIHRHVVRAEAEGRARPAPGRCHQSGLPVQVRWYAVPVFRPRRSTSIDSKIHWNYLLMRIKCQARTRTIRPTSPSRSVSSRTNPPSSFMAESDELTR